MRCPNQWQASPKFVRLFHGDTSTVIDWQEIAAARRMILDTRMVAISGFLFDKSDLASIWGAMVDARERQREDDLADQSMDYEGRLT